MYETKLLTTDYMNTVEIVLTQARKLLAKNNGLSIPQYRILDFIASKGGSSRVKNIVQSLENSPSSLTYQMDLLEQKGLITRNRTVGNRRTVDVFLTEKGSLFYEKSFKLIIESMNYILAPLGEFLNKNVTSAASKTLLGTTHMKMLLEERSVGEVILYAAIFCSSLMKETVEAENLSAKEYRVLFDLLKHPNGIACGELANNLLLPYSELTGVLNKLSAENYIERTEDLADRRVILVDLTNAGYTKCADLTPKVESIFLTGIKDSNPETLIYMKKAVRIICKKRRAAYH